MLNDPYIKIVEYCDFGNTKEDECYILMLLARKKENPKQTEYLKNERAKRYIVQAPEDVDLALKIFDAVKSKNKKTDYRIYLSSNKRSITKALFEVQRRFLDANQALVRGDKNSYKQFYRLDSEFKSVLSNKKCRASKNFLFDVDYENDTEWGRKMYIDFLDELSGLTEIIYTDQTRNGFVIITKPFNLSVIKKEMFYSEYITLIHDGYLYIS